MSGPGVVVVGDPARTHRRLGEADAVADAGAGAAARFDNDTDTWTVPVGDGRALTARVLVDTRPGGNDTVAAHGVPNYFGIPGPHTERQAKYVAGCIEALRRAGATRIEARGTVRVRRVLPTRGIARFYLSGPTAPDDEIYDGSAVLRYDGDDYQVQVRLTGHLDPIDGRYHWQGMLFAELPGVRVTGSRVTLRIGEHAAEARIAEATPWGTLAVTGAAGYPPFALAGTEISLPPRV